MTPTVAAFVKRWQISGAEERANKDLFFAELCDVLSVPRPNPKTGDPALDTYVYEKDVRIAHEGGTTSVGRVDLYKEGHVLLEAKQGKGELSKKLGSAKRGTPGWNVAMADAYGQALGYARTLEKPPPFIVTADIGYCFDVYSSFDGTANYRPFPNAMASRLFFTDIEKHIDVLRRVFVDPYGLDPAKIQAKVTREVAAHLAELAQALEKAKHAPASVATFLMRCLFTMFAEDVGLLPANLFRDAIEKHWLESPKAFPAGIESLWRAMNSGGDFGFMGKLLRFNGGLFTDPSALPLTREHLVMLLEAAKCNWAEVEPAIFGTLLERALDPKERHALGAHYTPRSYVERLVYPTIEEPLRADWELVQAEVRSLVASNKLEAAKKAVRTFHQKLCTTRVLDPACGSGNFLYVTLDVFKRLETEVLGVLEGLGDKQTLLHAETIRVTPAQFLGIEKKRWAKEIAELVLWIGYLQHHFRSYGRNIPPPEPVLQDYRNIECRDAVLAYDREELVRDEKGKPVKRWDGETMKTHPVTGALVPDELAAVPMYRYVNPRKAAWPKADFIVGNPPFVGNKRMRITLGDGYVEALRSAHPDVPRSADLVMYWWSLAAAAVEAKTAARFGLITTNSIMQPFNRRVVDRFIRGMKIGLVFAIADHPWVDSHLGASVRIAMTVCSRTSGGGVLATVSHETEAPGDERSVVLSLLKGKINSDLSVGVDLSCIPRLMANRGLACPGVQLSGQGFVVSEQMAGRFAPATRSALLRPYLTGRDLTQQRRTQYVLDTFGLAESEIRKLYPDAYQWLLDRVKPERDQNPRDSYARTWWLHSEPRSKFRAAYKNIARFIVTSRTARHRVFQFLPSSALPETKVLVFAMEDSVFLGVLASRVHVVFATSAGGWLGVGNDSTYNHSACFEPFPFPSCSTAQCRLIRNIAEQLDAHRKRQQALHPELTITGMYNVLEKLRVGEALTAKEKIIHEQGLVSVLKQIHDDLDAAVFEAYGWPRELTDEQILERLVALNAERAEEEKNGLVRWLRPDFQNPEGAKKVTQTAIAGLDDEDDERNSTGATFTKPAWPKKLHEQVSAVRDRLIQGKSTWTAKSVAQSFKGASVQAVEPVLESLAALGLIVSYGPSGARKWRAARRAG